MNKVLSFLFPYKPYTYSVSSFLLVLRLLFGGLIMWHGITKIVHFDMLATSFPDPLALGAKFSLILAIFAEAFCGVAIIAGAFYRLALIPPIFAMAMALFVVHNGDEFAMKELALIYLVMFVLFYIMGAGGFSLDDVVAQHLHRERATDNHTSSAG
ncbi:MAG: DoxX family protein [Alistipes sp.]|nr:DoxX family protein [Alistipes sp.]